MKRLGGTTAEILAFGQVHGPYVRNVGNQTLVCAASAPVSWNVEIKRVTYDFEAQAKKNENSWDPGGDKQAKPSVSASIGTRPTCRIKEAWLTLHPFRCEIEFF